MKKIIILMFIWLFVFSLSAFAAAIADDELVLVKGKGVPVCEAHLKNLKSLELNEMVCERDKSYPEANDITMPKWEEVDLRENKELVKRIHKFFAIGDQFGALKIIDDEKEFEEYFNRILKYNSLKKTTVNIDNHDKPEIVMLYREPRCDVERNIAYNIPYSRPLFVLDEEKKLIDVQKTEPLLQNPFPRNIEAKAVNSGYQLYDIFIYKNYRYFDKWNVYDWTLTVYKLSKSKVTEVCQYKYKTNHQK